MKQTTGELANELRQIATAVESGDSFEGSAVEPGKAPGVGDLHCLTRSLEHTQGNYGYSD